MSTSTPIICGLLLLAIGYSQVDANFKIYRGREVEPHSRPWQAWLLIGKRRVKCGATLIAPKYVLTAASCVQQPINGIILGDHSRAMTEGTEQVFSSASITQHPSYNHTSRFFTSDLAIIELDAAANVSVDEVSVLPILPDDHLTDNIFTKHTRVSGWGYEVLNDTNKLVFQSDVLLEYTADVADSADCDAIGTPADSECYTPFRDPDSVTCEGDVGGPMIVKRKRVWHLAGVINGFDLQLGCAPGLKAATKVPMYIDWINSVIL